MNQKMKTFLYLLLMLCPVLVMAQQDQKKNEEAVRAVINAFFEILDSKDTAKYSTLVLPEGQIWRLKMANEGVKTDVRTFAKDKLNLASMKSTIQERALAWDIQIHDHIAMAWVPYTLDVDHQFSHCGIDVFTLMLTDEGWRIVSLAYTVEPDGCGEVIKK